jgi:Uma2 family endonuclease
MAPAGYENSEQNGNLFGYVWAWNLQAKQGRIFDSSGGFALANGALSTHDFC